MKNIYNLRENIVKEFFEFNLQFAEEGFIDYEELFVLIDGLRRKVIKQIDDFYHEDEASQRKRLNDN